VISGSSQPARRTWADPTKGSGDAGTVVRVETDADGTAKYEAHMTDASGNPVTVYVDSNFDFVSVQERSRNGGGWQIATPRPCATYPTTC
jgi:hypothetical protein